MSAFAVRLAHVWAQVRAAYEPIQKPALKGISIAEDENKELSDDEDERTEDRNYDDKNNRLRVDRLAVKPKSTLNSIKRVPGTMVATVVNEMALWEQEKVHLRKYIDRE